MAVITIGGPPGSGTTTIAEILSDRLGLKYVYTGDIFRELADKRNMTLAEFGEYTKNHPEIDRELDDKQLELAKAGSVILEGRMAGWIVLQNEIDAFKIWLEASLEIRAERVSKREDLDVSDVLSSIKEREEVEQARYLKLYKFDITDLSIYDIVVDTGPLTPEQICDFIITKLQGSNR